jgi:hypothetical protein
VISAVLVGKGIAVTKRVKRSVTTRTYSLSRGDSRKGHQKSIPMTANGIAGGGRG